MKRKNTAVYAGSFDPLTNGHVWMIEQGARLFEELVVAIGVNPGKQYTFSLDERVAMLEETTRSLPNARVATFQNQFLVRYTRAIGAAYILRGIRNSQDYEFEKTMRYVNGDLDGGGGIETVFLMPPREIAEVSSSFVKGLVGPDGWQEAIKRYVPPALYEKFLLRFASRP